MTSAHRIWIRGFFAPLFLLLASSLSALVPNFNLSQYAHSTWRVQDGAFRGAPNAIAQTKDGYLWIGTEGGLVRFDGVRFVPWSPPTDTRLLDPRIFALLGTRDGSLWIGTGYSVSHLQRDQLINYPQLSGRVESIAEDADGSVWIARTQITDGMGPLCRIRDEQPQCYGKADGIPFPIALQVRVDNSGDLWIAGYSEICRWRPGSSTTKCFAEEKRRPETFASIKAIATGRNRSLWLVRDRSAKELQAEYLEQEKWSTRRFPEIAVNNSDVTTLLVDRDNSLWIGTANHGMFRATDSTVEHFGRTDGLSSDAVIRFYQDSEGTVWVVTSAGIDNFRDLKVVTYSMREGLSAAGAGTVLASRNGSVWVGNFHSLDMVRADKLTTITPTQGLPGKYVTTFFEDHAGTLWVGVDDGLWTFDHGSFSPIRRDDGSALGVVFSITEDTQHNIWVRAGHNLDRIADFRVREETTSPQVSNSYILASNPRGGIYLGLVNGDLIEYQDGKTRTYASNEIGNTRQIRDLLVEPDGSVWGTTLDEVVRWKNGERKNLNPRNGLPCDEIFALVQDTPGSLWIDSKCGLIRIEKSQLDAWWEHPESVVRFTFLDAFDGMQSGLTPLKPQATMSADGRLWFVNGRILQMLDPAHLQKNPVPPPVQIEEVLADRRRYAPKTGLRLPALTRDLEIDYTALSYVAPLKVQFRYRLEGHDPGWQETRTRRQAFYNDLGPGQYRFRVMAANNDGVWNETGAALEFSILPAYYQTTWFRMLCAASFLSLLWAMYRYRVHQLQRQFAIAMDARINERTRIARDLHDTLLQTLHGLMFQFQAVRNLLPRRPEDAMRSLDEAIVETEKALSESRDAIQGIRSEPSAQADLAESLRAVSEEFAGDRNAGGVSPAFDLIQEGQRRALSSTVNEEVRRIATEVLRNAFRHSQATRIEVEIRYDYQMLRIRIRDNGRGIDPNVLKAGGVAGHWGLKGVRERTERIAAKIEFWGESGLGTEVQLSVPAAVAYNPRSENLSGTSFRKTNKRAQP